VTKYPWALLQRLADRVTEGSAKPATGELAKVLRIIGASRHTLAVRKLRCAQVISFCLRGAHTGGVSTSQLLDLHVQVLEQLERARTWHTVTSTMHGLLEKLVGMVSVDLRTDIDRFVQWMRQDMASTLDHPKQLQHYATAADVSLEHLSRVFLARTGTTFSDCRKKMRLDKARKILQDQDQKIQNISRMVGIKSVARFTQMFRAEFGITPAQFRRTSRTRRSKSLRQVLTR
jgi:AraC-like DNA-binding protein